MRQLRIGICEDDVTQLKYLKQQVEAFYKESGILAVIESFESAEQLLFNYPEDLPFNCLLLDIGLKKMDGMALAKKIRNRDRDVSIIFITGERDYVFEGYKVGAVRFLLKPYTMEDLREALLCIADREPEKPDEYIGIKIQGEYLKLKKKDILYAEVKGHYLSIKTSKQDYVLKGSMKKLKEELNDSCFVFASRSVLVNMENVEKIARTECILCGGICVSVSRGCYQHLNESFMKFYINC